MWTLFCSQKVKQIQVKIFGRFADVSFPPLVDKTLNENRKDDGSKHPGSGILVLPYAWKQAGWLFVLPFLAVALMMSFTLWLTGFPLGKRIGHGDVWMDGKPI